MSRKPYEFMPGRAHSNMPYAASCRKQATGGFQQNRLRNRLLSRKPNADGRVTHPESIDLVKDTHWKS